MEVVKPENAAEGEGSNNNSATHETAASSAAGDKEQSCTKESSGNGHDASTG